MINKRTEDGWTLLEEKSINDRTLICWYNPNNNVISLCLFNLTEQPNALSKRSPHSNWGYITLMVTNMMTTKEAAEVVGLYLQDMEKENYWWEKIN